MQYAQILILKKNQVMMKIIYGMWRRIVYHTGLWILSANCC